MDINTQEINGFIIETFNQHNLEEGKKQGICPLCSFKRKPKNQFRSYIFLYRKTTHCNPRGKALLIGKCKEGREQSYSTAYYIQRIIIILSKKKRGGKIRIK